MSHFSLLVVGSDVDTQMIPFQEHSSTGKCPKQYLKFEDAEEECLKSYETDTAKEFYCSSSSTEGQVLSKELYNKIANTAVGNTTTLFFKKSDLGGFSAYFELNEYYDCSYYIDRKVSENRVWIKVVKIHDNNDHPDETICFEGTIEVERVNAPRVFPAKEKYITFDQYMKEYNGYGERDAETGRYGRWENPNAKWDWYTVGGRFNNFLLLKNGLKADSARKGDVDWETMKNDAGHAAAERYDLFQRHFGKLPVNVSWEDSITKFDEDYDAARNFYRNQDRVVEYDKKCRELNIGNGFYDSPDDFLISKEQYVENARRDAIRTFAVLIDGTWNEKGEMGWFGVVHNEKEADNWRDIYETILNNISDDMQITVVDCHI